MANKWRPQGWENPYVNWRQSLGESRAINKECFYVFEKGADAMLDNLRKISLPGYDMKGGKHRLTEIPDDPPDNMETITLGEMLAGLANLPNQIYVVSESLKKQMEQLAIDDKIDCESDPIRPNPGRAVGFGMDLPNSLTFTSWFQGIKESK